MTQLATNKHVSQSHNKKKIFCASNGRHYLWCTRIMWSRSRPVLCHLELQKFSKIQRVKFKFSSTSANVVLVTVSTLRDVIVTHVVPTQQSSLGRSVDTRCVTLAINFINPNILNAYWCPLSIRKSHLPPHLFKAPQLRTKRKPSDLLFSRKTSRSRWFSCNSDAHSDSCYLR